MESLLCVNDIMRCISTSRGLLRRRWAALEHRLRALVKRRGFWAGEWVVLVAGDVAMVIRRRVVVEATGSESKAAAEGATTSFTVQYEVLRVIVTGAPQASAAAAESQLRLHLPTRQALPQAEFVQQFGTAAWDTAMVVEKEVVDAAKLEPLFLGLDGEGGDEAWRIQLETTVAVYGLRLKGRPIEHASLLVWLCRDAEKQLQIRRRFGLGPGASRADFAQAAQRTLGNEDWMKRADGLSVAAVCAFPGVDVNAIKTDDDHKYSPLHLAVLFNNLEAVGALLAVGAAVNARACGARQPSRRTAIQWRGALQRMPGGSGLRRGYKKRFVRGAIRGRSRVGAPAVVNI